MKSKILVRNKPALTNPIGLNPFFRMTCNQRGVEKRKSLRHKLRTVVGDTALTIGAILRKVLLTRMPFFKSDGRQTIREVLSGPSPN